MGDTTQTSSCTQPVVRTPGLHSCSAIQQIYHAKQGWLREIESSKGASSRSHERKTSSVEYQMRAIHTAWSECGHCTTAPNAVTLCSTVKADS